MYLSFIKKILPLLFFTALLLTPLFAFAHTISLDGPIVFCGTTQSANLCGVCDLFHLVKDLLDLAFFEIIPLIATLAIVYAGLQLVFSGSPLGFGSKSEAKNIFKSVLIGLLTAYSAWLIVNTIVVFFASQVTLNGVNFKDNWYKFSCKVTSSGVINAGGIITTGSGNTGGGSPVSGLDTACRRVFTEAGATGCLDKNDTNCIKVEDLPVFKNGRIPCAQGSSGNICLMYKASAENFAKFTEALATAGVCKVTSINSTIQGLKTGVVVSQSKCHSFTNTGSFLGGPQGKFVYPYGTCADVSLSAYSKACLDSIAKVGKETGTVSSFLFEGVNNSELSCPTSGTGMHIHINFNSGGSGAVSGGPATSNDDDKKIGCFIAPWTGQDPYSTTDKSKVQDEVLELFADLGKQFKGITIATGGLYRPQAYQDHIRSINDALHFIKNEAVNVRSDYGQCRAETITKDWSKCSNAFKTAVSQEESKHKTGATRPACISDHTTGIAIDIANIPGDFATFVRAAEKLGLCNYIKGDRPHFALKSKLPSNVNCFSNI